eukprot:4755741-Alexandrium_andersonii.AAC.1
MAGAEPGSSGRGPADCNPEGGLTPSWLKTGRNVPGVKSQTRIPFERSTAGAALATSPSSP